MASRHEATGRHLDALDGTVHVPGGAAGRGLLPQHLPRLDRTTQFEVHAGHLRRAQAREAEFGERRHPLVGHVDAVGAQVGGDRCDVLLDEVWQQEPVVQQRAPPDRVGPVRVLPAAQHKATDQQGLDQGHLGMWRHLEGAQLEQAEPAAFGVG